MVETADAWTNTLEAISEQNTKEISFEELEKRLRNCQYDLNDEFRVKRREDTLEIGLLYVDSPPSDMPTFYLLVQITEDRGTRKFAIPSTSSSYMQMKRQAVETSAKDVRFEPGARSTNGIYSSSTELSPPDYSTGSSAPKTT